MNRRNFLGLATSGMFAATAGALSIPSIPHRGIARGPIRSKENNP
ncbi:hypothetical protein EFD55_17345 [Rhizobium pisi]|uniref:Twin-arginine translocation signal domain-containing protein n=1 Tax=Rhizobium pisi TaxID=574561 RepID=A0A427MYC3_9HYPH|nr:hypothetical protein EFD55_17345 [Rhizobium pisi]TCA59019.1 hypothetical protein E0J16_11715 [Rhizobium pisi]